MKGFFLAETALQDIELDDIAHFFTSYKKEDWKYSDGGHFIYTDNQTEVSLLVIHSFDYGFSLQYESKNKNSSEEHHWYTLSDKSTINNFVDASDEVFLPLGSFINLEKAWSVIQEFFSDPLNKPKTTLWISHDEIDWSEYEEML